MEGRHGTDARASVREIGRRLDDVAEALDRGELETARALVERMRQALTTPCPPSLRLVGGRTVTPRESAILQLLPDGSLSQKDIARRLQVSPNTVKTHLKSLYRKLGVHCRGEAIQRARELGLLDDCLRALGPGPGFERAQVNVLDLATA